MLFAQFIFEDFLFEEGNLEFFLVLLETVFTLFEVYLLVYEIGLLPFGLIRERKRFELKFELATEGF